MIIDPRGVHTKKSLKSTPTHINQCHCNSSAHRHTLKCVKALIKSTNNKILQYWATACNSPRYLSLRVRKVM